MAEIKIDQQSVEMTQRALASLLVSHPDTRKRIQKIIRAELKDAANLLKKDAREAMKEDYRKAYLAVRYNVYKKILGGNLNILASRRAGQRAALIRERTLRVGQRGGNRRSVSMRTEQVETYYGKDRGFILRFLDSGTCTRTITFSPNPKRGSVNRGSQGGDLSKYGKTVNTGSRGKIAPRSWFANAAPQAISQVAGRLDTILNEELESAFNETSR